MPQTHYWIHGTADGKAFLYDGGTDEHSALQKGYQLVNCSFEITPLATSDITAAGRKLRGEEVNETGDIAAALRKRFRHTPMR